MPSTAARAAVIGAAGAVVLTGTFGVGTLPPDPGAPAAAPGGSAVDAIFHERADRPASRGGLGRAPLVGADSQARAQAPGESPAPAAPAPAPPAEIPDGCDSYSGNRLIGCTILPEFGFGLDQMPSLDSLWTHESGWNHQASNTSSGAYGIPQALPGSKMQSAGDDWETNPATQIRWGLGYITDRYGSPDAAWAFFQNNGWY